MNLPEQGSIVKTVGCGGVDFDQMTPKRKRRKQAADEAFAGLLQPVQIRMSGMTTCRSGAGKETLQEDCPIRFTEDLKWLKIMVALQIDKLRRS